MQFWEYGRWNLMCIQTYLRFTALHTCVLNDAAMDNSRTNADSAAMTSTTSRDCRLAGTVSIAIQKVNYAKRKELKLAMSSVRHCQVRSSTCEELANNAQARKNNFANTSGGGQAAKDGRPSFSHVITCNARSQKSSYLFSFAINLILCEQTS